MDGLISVYLLDLLPLAELLIHKRAGSSRGFHVGTTLTHQLVVSTAKNSS